MLQMLPHSQFLSCILVYSKFQEQHQEHLHVVLIVMAEQNFYANEQRCELGEWQVAYLGHVGSAKGMALDLSNVGGVAKWTFGVDGL